MGVSDETLEWALVVVGGCDSEEGERAVGSEGLEKGAERGGGGVEQKKIDGTAFLKQRRGPLRGGLTEGSALEAWVRGLLLLRGFTACRLHRCLACVYQTACRAPSERRRPELAQT